MESKYADLSRAVGILLGVCDGAHALDGMGFNGYDAGFAREMFDRFPNWSPRMAFAVWNMLRKYRGQLSGFGIEYDSLTAPERPEPKKPKEETPKATVPGEKVEGRVVEVFEKKIVVRFPYDPEVVSAVKELPGRRFDGKGKFWTVPVNLDSAVEVLRFADRYGFEVKNRGALNGLAVEAAAAVTLSRATTSEIEIPDLGGSLRPFQKAGVSYISNKGRVLLGDEMGLGKTVQAIAAIEFQKAYPALIVTPASLKFNWEKEVRKWVPGRSVVVLNGGTPTSVSADVVIINYDILKKWKETLAARGFASVVCDESHYLKNHKAQRTKAVSDLVKKTNLRLLLTGTPVVNRPSELLSQLQILGRLNEFGGFWTFAKRYCNAFPTRFGWDMSGAANLDELNSRLRAVCYVRRNKAEVLPELPAKTRTPVYVDLSNSKEYERASEALLDYLREVAEAQGEFLASIEGLPEAERKQAIANHGNSAVMRARRAETLVRINTLRRVVGKGKIDAAREWVENFLESGEKLVLFANHIEVQKTLLDAFPGAARILGADDAATRQANVERFQADPECRLIVCSLVAGGVGITLTAASNVAFVEYGWTPAVHEQAEDRTHRIGQENAVNVWNLVARETIEDYMLDLIEAKRAVVHATAEGEKTGKGKSILNELLGILTGKISPRPPLLIDEEGDEGPAEAEAHELALETDGYLGRRPGGGEGRK